MIMNSLVLEYLTWRARVTRRSNNLPSAQTGHGSLNQSGGDPWNGIQHQAASDNQADFEILVADNSNPLLGSLFWSAIVEAGFAPRNI